MTWNSLPCRLSKASASSRDRPSSPAIISIVPDNRLASKLRPVWNLQFFWLGREPCVSIWGLSLTRDFSRPVLRVDVSRWDQTAADLRDLALHAPHPRSRERFLALHEV